jgi:hypothetical protein
MGKGCKPRSGHSVSKFSKAYDGINWGKPSNEVKVPVDKEKLNKKLEK